ncbi:septal ring lytic transglycosylase RlpA family protein [Aestuariivirga sp.]|uniref:septal ring lytic transglycosylase RlpA family protein n=1 Tax=Aestuariivirga sp. TaxID=2650926 RepID=UPI00391B0DA5
MWKFARNAVVFVAIGLALAGCSSSNKQASRDPFAGKGSPVYPGKGPVPWGGGRYHVGKPYEVAGRWFEPKEQPGYDKKGTASWYGEAFNRRQTSNGEWFDMNRLTAAHPTLPLPSYVKVTNLENGREVVVRVNDRGPFVGTRVIDLSKRTAEVLDFKHKGKAPVRVQYIGPAPLEDNGKHLIAMNKELDRGTPMRKMIAAADRRRGRAPAENVMVAEAKPKKKLRKEPEAVAETVAYAPPAEQEAQAMEISWYVQLGSFTDAGNAQRARDQFSAVWPVQFIELSGAAGPVFRVRLGPISSKADAETALVDAQAAGYGDARLIKTEAVQAALQ